MLQKSLKFSRQAHIFTQLRDLPCHQFFALQVPDLMRKSSSKRILNQRPLNLPTKTLRTKSLLWVKPTVTVDQLSASVLAQVRNLPDVSQHNKICYK